MPTDFSDTVLQNPANIVAPNGFVGTHKFFFVGGTGLIGTGYGTPGFTATRVSTGIYRVKHPPVKELVMMAGIAMPSGAPSYKVDQITDGIGPTGRASTHPSTSPNVSAVVSTVPGVAICSMRAARCVVWPTAV